MVSERQTLKQARPDVAPPRPSPSAGWAAFWVFGRRLTGGKQARELRNQQLAEEQVEWLDGFAQDIGQR